MRRLFGHVKRRPVQGEIILADILETDVNLPKVHLMSKSKIGMAKTVDHRCFGTNINCKKAASSDPAFFISSCVFFI